jgi:hypothetical protein
MNKDDIDVMMKNAIKAKIKWLLGRDVRLDIEDSVYGYMIRIYDELSLKDLIIFQEANIPVCRDCDRYIIYINRQSLNT